MFGITFELDAPKTSTKGFSIRQDAYGKYKTSRMLFRVYVSKSGWDGTPQGSIIIGAQKDCTGERKSTKPIRFNLPYRKWVYQDHKLGKLVHRLFCKLYSKIDTRYS